MASVSKCDMCDNVVRHEEAVYLRVYSQTPDDKLKEAIIEKELCPVCFYKLKQALNML